MKESHWGDKGPQLVIVGMIGAGKSSVLKALEREFFRCFQEVLFNSKGKYKRLPSQRLTICEVDEEQLELLIARGSSELKECVGVIFVVDLAYPDQYPQASSLLGKILNHTTPQTELAILGHKSDVSGSIPIDEIIEQLKLGTLAIHNCHTFRIFHTSVMKEGGLSDFYEWVSEQICETNKPIANRIKEIFIHDSNGIPLGYVGDINGDTPLLVSAVYSALDTFLTKIGEGSSIKTLIVDGYEGPAHVSSYSKGEMSVLLVSTESWSSPSLEELGEGVLELFRNTDRELDEIELSVFDKKQFLNDLEEMLLAPCPGCEKFPK